MNKHIKRLAFCAADFAAIFLRLIPSTIRQKIILAALFAESRIGSPKESLRRLFALLDHVDLIINERAGAYGGGENPKHRLMKYHDFFVSHIPAGSKVLDIGCGYGAVARTIASRVSGVSVTGVDINAENIAQAQRTNALPNIVYRHADALKLTQDDHWDVIVLSNVLEHIDARVDFLKRISAQGQPRILVRVPLFERHWHVPFRRELGVNYFSDSTHYIEHSFAEFSDEIRRAGLTVVAQQSIWGEIWAFCMRAA